MFRRKKALTYDDIQLEPKYSEIESRGKIKLKTHLSERYGLLIPLVASPMDSVCESEMAYKLATLGGVGCIHRFMTPKEQANEVRCVYDKIVRADLYESWGLMFDDWHTDIKLIPIMAAIGVKEEDKERAKQLVDAGANVLIIDVAHGHHINVFNMINWCKTNLPEHIDIIAGNIATAQAAIDLEEAGANGLRVGIGGGCFTPEMLVKTTNGLKPIKDIVIDDVVYTHTGEKQSVINTMSYDCDEEIMIINNIKCTKNHEFYVINRNDLNKIKNDDDITKFALWIPASELSDEYLLIEVVN